jgi:hypothetical protein
MRTIAVRIMLRLALPVMLVAGCSETSPDAAPDAGGNRSSAGNAGSKSIEGGGASGGAGAAAHAGTVGEGGGAPEGGAAAGGEAIGGDAAGGADGAALSLTEIIAEYETWQPLSAQPFDVSVEILALCRAPTASEQAFVESEHSGFALRHWANPEAFPGVDDEAVTSFIEGSALVKQKIGYRAGDGLPVVLALGIMVKRSPGFNASTGDWEFAYYTETDGILADPETQAACGPCHASPRAKDFVFVDDSWRSSP